MNTVGKNIWAYDIGLNAASTPEVSNESAIAQSIEMIMATVIGERLFSGFGTNIIGYVFNAILSGSGEALLNAVTDAVRLYEKRVTIVDSACQAIINPDQHYVIVVIAYTINSGVTAKPNTIQKLIKRITP